MGPFTAMFDFPKRCLYFIPNLTKYYYSCKPWSIMTLHFCLSSDETRHVQIFSSIFGSTPVFGFNLHAWNGEIRFPARFPTKWWPNILERKQEASDNLGLLRMYNTFKTPSPGAFFSHKWAASRPIPNFATQEFPSPILTLFVGWRSSKNSAKYAKLLDLVPPWKNLVNWKFRKLG